MFEFLLRYIFLIIIIIQMVERTSQKSKADEKNTNVGKMQAGDYTIHVLIQKAKELAVPEASVASVLVQIESGKEKQFTKEYPEQTNKSETAMMEHIFLEKRAQSVQDLQNMKIKIAVLEKGLWKNAVIGVFEVDFQFIYFMPNNLYEHKWIALTNPASEDFSTVAGFIKISIQITGANDTPTQLSEDPDANEDVVMPAMIKPKFQQLKIHFFKGEHLPKMDRATLMAEGKMDAYLIAEIGGKKLKTEFKTTVRDECTWNQTMNIPVKMPLMASKLIVKLFDYDVSGDEICGSLIFDYKKLLKMEKGSVFWVNVEGPPGGDEQSLLAAAASAIGGRSEEYNEMCHNPEIATCWKCRVLVGVDYEDVDQPVCNLEEIKDAALLEKAKKLSVASEFQYMFMAGSVICPPADNAEYYLKVSIANHSWTCKKGALGVNFNRWNEKTPQIGIMMPYGSVAEIGSVYVYLMSKDNKPLSYAKFAAKEFMNPNPELRWVEFQVDPVIKGVSSHELAGICSFMLSIHKGDKTSIDFKSQPSWKKTIGKRANANLIRAFIYQARDLPAADEDGSSDPYLQIFDHWQSVDKSRKTHRRTRVVNDTCFPMYYQCIELSIEGSKDELPPFVIDVYDVDVNLITKDSRDFMCRSVIKVQDAAVLWVSEKEDDHGKSPEPKWHKCYFKQGGQPCGEILISFVIADQFDFQWRVLYNNIRMMGIRGDPSHTDAVVTFDEYNIEINVLGLRSLESSGILPVKKAYIKFGLKTLVPPISGAIVDDLSTVPGPFGSDPTLNTVVSFKMILPQEYKYAPSMACRVYDKIFTGFDGTLLGVFTIPVGEIMNEQTEEFITNKMKLKTLIKELEDILNGKALPSYTSAETVDNTKDKDFQSMRNSEKSELKKVFPDKTQSQNNTNSLKRPLITNADEDEDEDGRIYTNPAGINSKVQPYQAPKLNLMDGPDEEIIDTLKRTPRSQLTASQKQQVNQAILSDVINQEVQRPVNVLPKNMDPNDPNVFKPVASPKVSFKKLNDAIKEHYSGSQGGLDSPMSDGVTLVDKVGMGISKKVLKNLENDIQAKIRLQIKEQQISEQKMQGENPAFFNVNYLIPKYRKDDRLGINVEFNKPPINLFEPLGWDRVPGVSREKHYRRFYTQELETVPNCMRRPSDFDQYQLKKGQVRGASTGLFGGLFKKQTKDADGEISTSKSCGKFKGLIKVTRTSKVAHQQEDIQKLLSKVYDLLCELHTKTYMKPFPFKRGLFGEINITQKVLGDNKSESIKDNDATFGGQAKKLKDESGQESVSIMQPDGRVKFKGKMTQMGLQHLNMTRLVTEVQSDEILKKLLLVERKCIVRLYMLSAFNLAARDNDSPSDPYLLITLGDHVFNDRENYILDEPNPQFYKKINFEGVFPGCPQLKIGVWDYDLLFGDDLIGETVIDLEDRYFSSDWNAMPMKPIEYRNLYHPSSQKDQGTVKLWVEIIPTTCDTKTFLEFDISEKPAEEFEVRVCIFETEELKMMDVEGTTDGFVKTFFNPGDAKETDTHFRNQDGHCSWNYRMIHQIKVPSKSYKLNLQVYDRDFFASNDLIGDSLIDLKPLFDDASLTKNCVSLNRKYYDGYLKEKFPNYTNLTFDSDGQSFWVNLVNKNAKGELEVNGRLRIQIDVLPKVEAEKNKVGEAQSEPNVNPFLPKPEGRMELSLNPFKMIAQLVGPQFRRMGYTIILTIFCIALCVMMAPMILSNLFSSIIVSIFT